MSSRSPDVGPLEMQILGIVSSLESASVQDVQTALKKTGQNLAYTTVMTVMGRLFDKGYFKRLKQSRQYLYSSAKTKGTSSNSKIFQKIQSALFLGDRLRPILALLEGDSELSADELKELRRRVNEKLQQAEKSIK